MKLFKLKISCIVLILVICVFLQLDLYKVIALQEINHSNLRKSPQLPSTHFSPSNAQTEDGNLISAKDFVSAKRCSSCHQETHFQWSESLHRNASRDPFYQESVQILEKQRGVEFTSTVIPVTHLFCYSQVL